MEGVQKWISNRFTLLKLIFQHWRQEVKSDPLSDQLESEKKAGILNYTLSDSLLKQIALELAFFM